jgi:hypothetical protein
MASIKEATANAIAFAREALGPERTKGIRLEEIESTTLDGQAAWRITLSMIPPPQVEGQLTSLGDLAAAFSQTRREYKTFTVLKGNGEVESMKIRELADA